MLAEAQALRAMPWVRLHVFDSENDLLSSARMYRVDRAQTDQALTAIAGIRTRHLQAIGTRLNRAQRRIFDSNAAALRAPAAERERFRHEWEYSQPVLQSPD